MQISAYILGLLSDISLRVWQIGVKFCVPGVLSPLLVAIYLAVSKCWSKRSSGGSLRPRFLPLNRKYLETYKSQRLGNYISSTSFQCSGQLWKVLMLTLQVLCLS